MTFLVNVRVENTAKEAQLRCQEDAGFVVCIRIALSSFICVGPNFVTELSLEYCSFVAVGLEGGQLPAVQEFARLLLN